MSSECPRCGFSENLLGDIFTTMSPDCIIKRGRPPAKGAPTPYLAVLKGARMAICDETPEEAVMDDEIVKRATGQTTLVARFLGDNPIHFKPTHLPILLTNNRPKINIADDAILRRLLVIPFDLIFKSPEDIDEGNGKHRPIDKGIAERLLKKQPQQQLLSWLIRGSKSWFESGLGETPARAKAAFSEYVAENDDIQKCIEECCETGKGFEVETSKFTDLYRKRFDASISHSKITNMMTKKGFIAKRSSSFQPRTMAYQGIRLTPESAFVCSDDEL